MTPTTLHRHPSTPPGTRQEHLRDVLPAAAATLLLLALALALGLVLRDLLDFGVWMLTTR